MAWLSRNNVQPTDSLTADMLNSLANDIRFWGGDVNGGGYKLTNVILSGSGGFERAPSPMVVAPVAAGGSSEIQLADYVAGTPDTFPPRWKMAKGADPTPDFSIERYNQFGSLLDKPMSIRMADGIVVLKAQQWTGPVNAEGQTISNVNIGSGSSIPWDAIVGEPASYPPGPHTHAAADTTSGVFAVARLGSGTPDNTKFLRGDGSWVVIPPQTPWVSDVDAAGFRLTNVGLVATAGLTISDRVTQGSGMNYSWNAAPSDQWRYVANGPAFSMAGGPANWIFYRAPSGIAGDVANLTPAITVEAATGLVIIPSLAPAITGFAGWWSNGKPRLGIEANDTHFYFWRYDDNGSNPSPFIYVERATGDVFLNTQTARAPSAHDAFAINTVVGLNLKWESAQYRYMANGMAAMMFTDGSNVYFQTAPSGTAGTQATPLTSAWKISPAGVMSITSLDKASLGSGTPDSTKYLRGDGVWAIPPGGAGGGQTPWVSNIDGATYALYNAGLIQITTNRTPTSGSGLELTYDGVGHVTAMNRPAGTFRELRVYGNPLKLHATDTEAVRIESGRTTVLTRYLYPQQICAGIDSVYTWNLDESSGQWRYNTNGYGHFISGSNDGSIKFATATAGTAGNGANPRTLAMFSGGALIMPTSAGAVFFNITYSDAWRYQDAGAGALLRLSGNNFELWNAPSGSAGAVAPVGQVFWDDGATFVMKHRYVVQAPSSRPMSIEGPYSELNLDFYRTNGGADDKYGRISGSGGAIGLERINDAYNQIVTYARLDRYGFGTNVPLTVAIYNTGGVGGEVKLTNQGAAFAETARVSFWGGVSSRASVTQYLDKDACGAFRFTLGQDGNIENLPTFLAVTRYGTVSRLPRGNFDGDNGFSGIPSACYTWFNASDKTLRIRFHEEGVAYREYILKEGDQGAGLLMADAPGDLTRTVTGTLTAPYASIQVPATAKVVQVSVTYQNKAGTVQGIRMFVDVNPNPVAAGGTNFSANQAMIVNGTAYNNDTVYMNATVTPTGAGKATISGESWINSGAKTNSAQANFITTISMANAHVVFGVAVTTGNGSSITRDFKIMVY